MEEFYVKAKYHLLKFKCMYHLTMPKTFSEMHRSQNKASKKNCIFLENLEILIEVLFLVIVTCICVCKYTHMYHVCIYMHIHIHMYVYIPLTYF